MLFVFGGYGGSGAHKRLDDLIAIDVSTCNAYCHVITGKPAHRVSDSPACCFGMYIITILLLAFVVACEMHQIHDLTAFISVCIGHIFPVHAADSTSMSSIHP